MLNSTLNHNPRMFGLYPGSHHIARTKATASAVALHEAGHAIALLASGYRVRRVYVDGHAGCCQPEGPVCDRVMAIVSAAGCLAEGVEGHGHGAASDRDEQLFSRSLGERDERGIILEATSLLLRHKAEVLFLARALDERKTITADGFRELCGEPDSPLACYASLYRERPRQPTRPLSQAMVPAGAAISRRGIF